MIRSATPPRREARDVAHWSRVLREERDARVRPFIGDAGNVAVVLEFFNADAAQPQRAIQ